MPVDPKVLTVTTTVQIAASYSKRRTSLVILNRSTSVTVYVGNTRNVTQGAGFDLPPTGTIVFAELFGDDPKLERNVVTSSGTADIVILSEYLTREI